MPYRVIVACLMFSICLAGCFSNEPARLMVSGGVEGQAGEKVNGVIRFVPKSSGPAATADIKNGKFQFGSEDGPLAGDYDVFVEVAAHNKRMFLASGQSKREAKEVPKELEYKFTVNVSEDKLTLANLVLSAESAVVAE